MIPGTPEPNTSIRRGTTPIPTDDGVGVVPLPPPISPEQRQAQALRRRQEERDYGRGRAISGSPVDRTAAWVSAGAEAGDPDDGRRRRRGGRLLCCFGRKGIVAVGLALLLHSAAAACALLSSSSTTFAAMQASCRDCGNVSQIAALCRPAGCFARMAGALRVCGVAATATPTKAQSEAACKVAGCRSNVTAVTGGCASDDFIHTHNHLARAFGVLELLKLRCLHAAAPLPPPPPPPAQPKEPPPETERKAGESGVHYSLLVPLLAGALVALYMGVKVAHSRWWPTSEAARRQRVATGLPPGGIRGSDGRLMCSVGSKPEEELPSPDAARP